MVERSPASCAGSAGTSVATEATETGRPALQHYAGRISKSGRARYTEQNGQARRGAACWRHPVPAAEPSAVSDNMRMSTPLRHATSAASEGAACNLFSGVSCVDG